MILAVSLALFSGLLWSLANIIDKIVISKYVKNPLVIVPVVGLLSLLVGLTVNLSVKDSLDGSVVARIFLFSFIYFFSIIFYFLALKHEEASRVVPLYGLTPVYIALIEYLFFHKQLFLWQYLGIVAVVVGSAILTYKPGPAQVNKKGIVFALLSGIFWGTGFAFLADIFTKHGFLISWSWELVFIGCLGLFSGLFLVRELRQTIRQSGAKIIYLITGSELLSVGAAALIFYASTLWFASLVSAISSDQYVLVFLVSIFISLKWPKLFKEEIKKSIILQKTISILLIIVGIFFISW